MPAAAQNAHATGPNNITSATDTSFVSVTPGQGTWFVVFSGATQSPNAQTVTVSIYANGSQVADTEQAANSDQGTLSTTSQSPFNTTCFATVAAGQTIEGRARRTGGTGIMLQRQLSVFRIG